jgi:hypothetical protein
MIYCYGATARSWPLETPLAPLKKTLSHACGIPLRRASAFGLYALAAAQACVENRPADRSCALYLSTKNGTVSETVTGLKEVWQHQTLPLPFNFINLAPGSALFYLQEALGVRGFATLYSSQGGDHFALALQSALLALQAGRTKEALVGYVDEGYEGLAEVLGYPEPLDHVGGWIHLGCSPAGAKASLEHFLIEEGKPPEINGAGVLGSLAAASLEEWLACASNTHDADFRLAPDRVLRCRFRSL